MEPKKQWQKPQLVILGRGTPEEAVLGACKYNDEIAGQFMNRCYQQMSSSYCNSNLPS